MLGFHLIDIVVIVVYFAAMLYIGYRAMKKIKGQEDFFLGGRSFGKFLQTFSNFGQATSAESAVTASSMVGQKGMAGVFYSTFSGLFMLPLMWFTPLWYRRTRLMTAADLLVKRFNCRKLAALYAIGQASLFVMVGGMGLYAMSRTVEAIAVKPESAFTPEERAEYAQVVRLQTLEAKPAELLSDGETLEMESLRRQAPRERFSYINRNMLIVCMAIFILFYAIGGGLEAAVWTDAIQSMFIVLLTVLLIPFAMRQLNADFGTSGFVGPFQTVHQTLPAAMLEMFGSPRLAEFTWQYILLLSLAGAAGGFAYANAMTISGASKTEDAARAGCMYGIILKRLCSVVWAFLALLILVLYGSLTQDADLLWGIATKNLLPVGLTGLMVACLMAALMSSVDTHMLVVSALLTNNIYRPLLKQQREDAHFVKAGRIFGVIHVSIAVVIAMYSDNLFEMFKYMIMLNLTMGPCFLMAFLWRRTNLSGAWVSMGVSVLLTLFIPVAVSWIPAIRYHETLHTEIRPEPIVRTYIAKAQDVEARQKRIADWEMLNAAGKATEGRPEGLTAGEAFEQTFSPGAKAIFWNGGIKEDESGTAYGAGLFRAELYIFHLLGVDLEQKSIATSESLALLFKLVFPFAAVFLFGFIGKPVDDDTLDQFYGALLTPVHPDHDQDAKEMALTRHNPRRFNHSKLFPESNWYVRRWTWADWKGFVIAFAAMLSIGGFMFWLAQLGT